MGAAGGTVRLAKLDVDAVPEIAQALQVKSLPTVMIIHKGKLVDKFEGVLPDEALKKFIQVLAECYLLTSPPMHLVSLHAVRLLLANRSALPSVAESGRTWRRVGRSCESAGDGCGTCCHYMLCHSNMMCSRSS